VEWDHDGYSYQQMGSLINGWGGDLLAENVSIHDTSGAAYYVTPAINYWGLETTVSGLSFTDNSAEVEGSYNYVFGPFSIDGVLEQSVEHVTVSGNHLEMDTASASNASLYGPFLGAFGSDTSSELRFVEVRDNHVETTGGEVLRVYGLVLRTYYDDVELSNLIIARNSLDESASNYGLFYGSTLDLSNADIVDNDLGYAYSFYGLIYAYGDSGLSVVNTNFVGNVLEAEIADYGRYVYLPTEDSEFVWDSNNLYDNSLDGEVDLVRYGDVELSATNGLTVDPLYTDREGGDYTLSASSPLIDAGNEDLQDADGSASDVGAYGGPYGEGWE
jgi:hypothetical protein